MNFKGNSIDRRGKNMIISIGSRSMPKTIAVMRAFSRYPELWMEKENKVEYRIMSKETRKDNKKGKEKDNLSDVSCNPLTLNETIIGAKNRAKKAYEQIEKEDDSLKFGVGIEAGMYPVEEVSTKYMDCSICSIYDGKEFYIGFSPSFEYPQIVVDRTLAGEEIGFMTDVFGNTAKGRKGAIGVLTDGRIYRDELEEYAVMMALTKIVSKNIYE